MSSIKTVISPAIKSKLQFKIDDLISKNIVRKIKKVNPYLYINQINHEDYLLEELYVYLLEIKALEYTVGKLILTHENHQVHYYFDFSQLIGCGFSNSFHKSRLVPIEYEITISPQTDKELQLKTVFDLAHKCVEELREDYVLNVIGQTSELYYEIWWQMFDAIRLT